MKNMETMKTFILYSILFLTLSCTSQGTTQESVAISVSPVINKDLPLNKKILDATKQFLRSKNESLTENEYWITDDFKKYVHPYEGIYKIEQSKFGPNFYQPTVMEIINTDIENKKIVKIAFIGHNEENNENVLRGIYNIVANIDNEKIMFSNYLEYATKDWEQKRVGSINYYISPLRKYNLDEMKKQKDDINTILNFFSSDPINISYFSCIDPIEVFKIKGFDYNTMMYVSKTGGLAERGDIIFSGNNSDIYTHEIVHIYIYNFFPNTPKIIDEGLATYLGGSGVYDYKWHKDNLRKYLASNKIDFSALVDNPYERIYINDETPIPYMVGALICEKMLDELGKEKFLNLLREYSPDDDSVWDLLGKAGLSRENLTEELQSFL